jgi:hypothetical protein
MIKQQPTITLDPKKTIYFLSSIAIFLFLANLIALLMKYVLGHEYVFGLVPFFDFDEEKNAPTLFSTCLFLINAILFLGLWKVERITSKPQKFWILLSVTFCFLATDEFCMLHERIIFPLGSLLNTSGFFLFAWIIPYGIAVVLLGILGIPVLWRIERRIRFWFGLSAVIFITGAIGFEMIGGKYLDEMDMIGKKDIVYALMTTSEELLEMIGLIILIFALLSLIQVKCGGFLVLFRGVDNTSSPSNR